MSHLKFSCKLCFYIFLFSQKKQNKTFSFSFRKLFIVISAFFSVLLSNVYMHSNQSIDSIAVCLDMFIIKMCEFPSDKWLFGYQHSLGSLCLFLFSSWAAICESRKRQSKMKWKCECSTADVWKGHVKMAWRRSFMDNKVFLVQKLANLPVLLSLKHRTRC